MAVGDERAGPEGSEEPPKFGPMGVPADVLGVLTPDPGNETPFQIGKCPWYTSLRQSTAPITSGHAKAITRSMKRTETLATRTVRGCAWWTPLALLMLLAAGVTEAYINTKVLNICQPGSFAMTFDQGPSIYTGNVLDALDAKQCKATFHPVVSFLQEPSIVANLQRAYSSGHLIGFSIEEQVDLSALTNNDDLLALLADRAATIQRAIGSPEPPYFVRVPKISNLSDDQISAITDQGKYVLSTYNLDSYDYALNGTDILSSFKNVLDQLSPNTKGGFISVQRDYIQSSVDAVPDIIDYIQGKGYSLVTLDKCFRGGVVPGHTNSSNESMNSSSSHRTPTLGWSFLPALGFILATALAE
ncbi:hypothetical protein MDAP_001228 [Mitosporidium daphniae]